MRDLTLTEVEEVSGAGTASDIGYAVGYAIGTVISLPGEFGSWLGGAIYDATHC